jgi:hypothetical protein
VPYSRGTATVDDAAGSRSVWIASASCDVVNEDAATNLVKAPAASEPDPAMYSTKVGFVYVGGSALRGLHNYSSCWSESAGLDLLLCGMFVATLLQPAVPCAITANQRMMEVHVSRSGTRCYCRCWNSSR